MKKQGQLFEVLLDCSTYKYDYPGGIMRYFIFANNLNELEQVVKEYLRVEQPKYKDATFVSVKHIAAVVDILGEPVVRSV